MPPVAGWCARADEPKDPRACPGIIGWGQPVKSGCASPAGAYSAGSALFGHEKIEQRRIDEQALTPRLALFKEPDRYQSLQIG